MKCAALVAIVFVIISGPAQAQTQTPAVPSAPAPVLVPPSGVPTASATPPVLSEPPKKAWYEKLSLRGYGQFRYNRAGHPNANLLSSQGDRSIGGTNNFFIRRARLIVSGDVADNVSVYIQPDLVNAPDNQPGANFAQLRDFYVDIALDPDRESRIRVGQSKVPYGFENMQSSQNRLALDRNDALNSAVKDERDTGVFYYWAPKDIRHRFKTLVDTGLKGSGDYGLIGIGGYNGQAANRAEANDDLHYVARVTYPFLLANGQYLETSLQAYTGYFTVPVGTNNAIPLTAKNRFLDRRVGVSLIYYPQPFGVQAEYNIGEGPELNDTQTEVTTHALHGGYLQLMYHYRKFMFFTRAQSYRGGRKHEAYSPKQRVDETELGVEWQANNAIELTGMYTWTDRTSSVAPYRNENGNLVRVQLQWNF